MPSWDHFFDYEMPQSVDDPDFHYEESSLLQLVTHYGGPIQLPIRDQTEYVLPTGPFDYVDPISFNRGPVRNEAENDRILKELGLPALPKRAKRKKKKQSDSDDDNDDDDIDDDEDKEDAVVASSQKHHNKKKSSSCTDKKSATRKSKSEKKIPKDCGTYKMFELTFVSYEVEAYVVLNSFVSDDGKAIEEFHLKENVKNIHNLSAVVCAVHGDGTYDVQYRAGDFDRNIDGSLLKKVVVQKQMPVNKKKRKAFGDYDIVQAAVQTSEEYFKYTSIDPVANVLPEGVKRLRKSRTST